jgi:hypothetical protein
MRCIVWSLVVLAGRASPLVAQPPKETETMPDCPNSLRVQIHVGRGDDVIAFAREFGCDGCDALVRCRPDIARRLVAFHKSKGFARIPNPARVIQFILYAPSPDDLAVFVMVHAKELENTSTFAAFEVSPFDFVYGHRPFMEVAKSHENSSPAEWLTKNKLLVGVAILAAGFAWMSRSRRSAEPSM